MTTPLTAAPTASRTVALGALPRINLLPPEIAAARAFRRRQVGLGGVVAAAVIAVGLLWEHAHGGVGAAQADLDTAQARQSQLQSQVSRLSDVTQVYAQVAARQAMLQQALGGEVQWSHYLNDLSLTVPENVWLTQFSASLTTAGATTGAAPAAGATAGAATGTAGAIGTVSFTGTALGHDDVATWLESLAREKGYANPYFTSSQQQFIGPRSVVVFQSSVDVTDAARSGRYSKPSGS